MRIHPRLLLASSLALAVLASPRSAHACGGGAVNEITFLGWTKDSRLAAYEETTHGGSDDDEGDAEEGREDDHYTVTLGVTIDRRTGEVRRYVLKLKGKPSKEERAKYAALPRAAAFEALRPFVPPHAGGRSPNGARRLLVLDGNGKDRWDREQGGYAPDPDEEDDANRGVAAAMEVAGEVRRAPGWAPGSCSQMACWALAAYWSPDSQAVAWMETRSGAMGYHEAIVSVQFVALSVQILSDRRVAEAQRAATEAALKKLGVEVTDGGPTRDPRTRSVVYFRKGNEQDAAAVAKAVPGGAAVEPLTWSSQHDLVLALAAR